MSLKRKSEQVLTASASDLKKPKTDSAITSFFGPPKTTASGAKSASKSFTTSTGSAKFDKEKWVTSLSAEQRKLLKLEIDTLDESWLAQLKDEVVNEEFLNLKRFLQKEIDSGKKIYPPLEEVYSWSRHTPLNTVKAVILGQDPYHNHNQAHGLCFSVRPPTPAPPSLKNMYIALKNDYPSFAPPPKNGGLLTPWAEQGILMLNTCLTVRAHEANSHSKHGWERFTQKVIDTVAKVRTKGVVFLAWGSPAAKRVAMVNKSKHLVLQSAHPSPLSASRGFFNCGHFKKTNTWLAERYGADGTIDWDLNEAKPIAAPPVTDQPVEVTDGGKSSSKPKAGPTTELAEPAAAKKSTATATDDFDDDDDAIEALEAFANSSANGEISSPTVASTAMNKYQQLSSTAASDLDDEDNDALEALNDAQAKDTSTNNGISTKD